MSRNKNATIEKKPKIYWLVNKALLFHVRAITQTISCVFSIYSVGTSVPIDKYLFVCFGKFFILMFSYFHIRCLCNPEFYVDVTNYFRIPNTPIM